MQIEGTAGYHLTRENPTVWLPAMPASIPHTLQCEFRIVGGGGRKLLARWGAESCGGFAWIAALVAFLPASAGAVAAAALTVAVLTPLTPFVAGLGLAAALVAAGGGFTPAFGVAWAAIGAGTIAAAITDRADDRDRAGDNAGDNDGDNDGDTDGDGASANAGAVPRAPAARPPRCLVFDGAIAAGKSTMLERFRKLLEHRGLRVVVVPEPVAVWEKTGALDAFCADRERFSYAFQSFAVVTRLQALRDVNVAGADVVLFERCLWTDRVFFELAVADGMVADVERKMYDVWCTTWARLIPEALRDARWEILYMQTSPKVCQERFERRAREGEKYSAEYFARLTRAYSARLYGLHAEEFPELAREFRESQRLHVQPIEPQLADQDTLELDAEHDQLLIAIADRLQLGTPSIA